MPPLLQTVSSNTPACSSQQWVLVRLTTRNILPLCGSCRSCPCRGFSCARCHVLGLTLVAPSAPIWKAAPCHLPECLVSLVGYRVDHQHRATWSRHIRYPPTSHSVPSSGKPCISDSACHLSFIYHPKLTTLHFDRRTSLIIYEGYLYDL